MVDEAILSDLLSEFARTMATDFPIQGILDHLVLRIVQVLPVTSAGVTLIDSERRPRYVAASDASASHCEQLQSDTGDGPCLAAYESGDAVAIGDLASDARFPLFTEAALASGLRATFTFPLRHGDARLGALDLYRDSPGALDGHDMATAQTLADVAAAYLLNAQARADARASADRFHHIALHDSLTGLPNRMLLEERLAHAAQRARRSHTNAAILFADLDHFKQVNDTYGHHVGDELLFEVARRLSRLVRSSDTLARVSGDEFVFLCEDLHSAADVEILARRIATTLSQPIQLSDVELTVTASVGIAFAGPGEDVSDDLVVQADTAMYQVKRRGGAGHEIIDVRDSIQSSDFHTLQADLRTALFNDELDVAYQPIVRTVDGLLTGVEALLRWTHPVRGAVQPLTMVGVAEESGLISEVGQWVLERSCRDHSEWISDHPATTLDLAVNVSARQLARPGFPGLVREVLTETGVDPHALILEITESIFIEDSEHTGSVLADLVDMGIRLALDDFGTGYSSLSYLHRLPIEIVKVDQTFITEIGTVPGKAMVVAVANLAHMLGLSVTAEGVETQAQRDAVVAAGCESAQGFLYARPMSASAISHSLDVSPDAVCLPLRVSAAALS